MRYKLILFDIDGTLIDTQEKVLTSLQHALLRTTNCLFPQQELQFALGIPGREALKRLPVPDMDKTYTLWEAYESEYPLECPVFQGISDLLLKLREQKTELGIVTSQTRLEYKRSFAYRSIAPYFQYVVCSDDTLFPKPHPEPILHALKKTGFLPKETLYVGDTKYDMLCARDAKADFALALWGAPNPDEVITPIKIKTPEDLCLLL